MGLEGIKGSYKKIAVITGMFFMLSGGVAFCEENNTKNVEFKELPLDSVCFQQGKGYDLGELIINNAKEYKVLSKLKSSDDKCSKTYLPKIDFSQKTLLGKFTITFNLSVNYLRELIRDDSRKEIIYSIKILGSDPPVVSCRGGCRSLANLNLIVIPKVPPEYKVIFKLTGDFANTVDEHFNGGGTMPPPGH